MKKSCQNIHVKGSRNTTVGVNYGLIENRMVSDKRRVVDSSKAIKSGVNNFPGSQGVGALTEVKNLENELDNKRGIRTSRIKKILEGLLAIGLVLASFSSSTAVFSGDIKEVTENVIDIAEKLGLQEFQRSKNP